MVKLYISADIEGITGVVSPLQCSPKGDADAYRQAVHQMGLEVSAVVETAFACGVKEILINDAHLGMTNLTASHLPPGVSLLSGKPKAVAMAAGLDETFDGALYIGYHAKAGTHKGVLCHTFHSKLADVSVNGVSYGEGGINALYASLVHRVPVLLASGDKAFCEEFGPLVPEAALVQTKDGLGFAAAVNRPVEAVLADYRRKMEQLLGQTWKNRLLSLKPPYRVEITLINTLCADTAMLVPGWARLDGTRLWHESRDFQTLYLALQSAYAIQSYAAAQDYLM